MLMVRSGHTSVQSVVGYARVSAGVLQRYQAVLVPQRSVLKSGGRSLGNVCPPVIGLLSGLVLGDSVPAGCGAREAALRVVRWGILKTDTHCSAEEYGRTV
jgi:hypothetical protein